MPPVRPAHNTGSFLLPQPPPGQRPPSAPWYVVLLGVISLFFGPALGALNWFFVRPSIEKLEDVGAGPASTATLWIVIWIFCAVGGVCLLSGIGLCLRHHWGRWLSYVFVILAFLGVVVAAVSARVSANLAEVEIAQNGGAGFSGPVYIQYVAAVPALAPLYGLMLVVGLNLARARAWARRSAPQAWVPQTSLANPAAGSALRPGSGQAPPPYPPPARFSTLALMSMVTSLIPFLLIPQLAALVMGIVALRRIKRSRGSPEGHLEGRGFALAGVGISSAILLCIGGLVGLGLTIYLFDNSSSLLSGSPELHEVRRWELPRQKSENSDELVAQRVTRLEFSPDGTLLMGRTEGGLVHVWQVATGIELASWPAPGLTVSFTHDGNEILALSSEAPTVVYYDARSGRELRRTHLDATEDTKLLTFSRGAPGVIGGRLDKQVVLWSAESGQRLNDFSLPPEYFTTDESFFATAVFAIAASADARRILVSGDGRLYLCDPDSGTVEHRFEAKYQDFDHILFFADGSRAIAGYSGGSRAGRPLVLNLQTGAAEPFADHRWDASCFDLTPDGTLAVSGGQSADDAGYIAWGGTESDHGRDVIVWDPQTRKRIATSYAPDATVGQVAISADGKHVVAADRSGAIFLFELLR